MRVVVTDESCAEKLYFNNADSSFMRPLPADRAAVVRALFQALGQLVVDDDVVLPRVSNAEQRKPDKMNIIQSEDWHFLCGMPEEVTVIQRVFPGVPVLSGTDKLNLPALVRPTCRRLVVSGLFGGLTPGIDVGDFCTAATIVDKAGTSFDCDPQWSLSVFNAGKRYGLTFGVVPWYSSGLLDEADSMDQRAAIFKKYGAMAIDDEARYAVALAQLRHSSGSINGLMVNDARACSDDWNSNLPLAATGAVMNADGTTNLSYLFKAIAQEPLSDTIDLFAVAADFVKSLATLEIGLNVIKSAFS